MTNTSILNVFRLKYEYGISQKSFFVLYLGSKESKMVCILDKAIQESDVQVIKTNMEKLKSFNIYGLIEWFKHNLPNVYKNGYREIYLSRISIVDEINLSDSIKK
jgi:hypothetical protein